MQDNLSHKMLLPLPSGWAVSLPAGAGTLAAPCVFCAGSAGAPLPSGWVASLPAGAGTLASPCVLYAGSAGVPLPSAWTSPLPAPVGTLASSCALCAGSLGVPPDGGGIRLDDCVPDIPPFPQADVSIAAASTTIANIFFMFDASCVVVLFCCRSNDFEFLPLPTVVMPDSQRRFDGPVPDHSKRDPDDSHVPDHAKQYGLNHPANHGGEDGSIHIKFHIARDSQSIGQ